MVNIVNRIEIAEKVTLNFIKSEKFKTNFISCCFITKISKDSAFNNALIPFVLRRGSKKYCDMKSLNLKLLDLYGAKLNAVVRKSGNNQIVELYISFIEDKFALNKEEVLESALDLFFDVIFDPITENGVFLKKNVTAEKENLADLIKARKNDKRVYAEDRCISIMCKDEPFGVPETGFEEDAQKVDEKILYDSYLSLINSSKIEFFMLASSNPLKVEKLIKEKIKCIDRSSKTWGENLKKFVPSEISTITEETDTSQSKLCIGMRINCSKEKQFVVMLFNAMFGGTPVSKLFLNVREKLSLCYYCSSKIDKLAGVLTVNSGVESKNKDKAVSEIINQLDLIKKGDFSEADISSAKLYITNFLQSAGDSQNQIEDWYLSQLEYDFISLEEACKQIQTVTKSQIVEVANTVAVDTVYFLKGE